MKSGTTKTRTISAQSNVFLSFSSAAPWQEVKVCSLKLNEANRSQTGGVGSCFLNETSWMWRDSRGKNCWHSINHQSLGKAAVTTNSKRTRAGKGECWGWGNTLGRGGGGRERQRDAPKQESARRYACRVSFLSSPVCSPALAEQRGRRQQQHQEDLGLYQT